MLVVTSEGAFGLYALAPIISFLLYYRETVLLPMERMRLSSNDGAHTTGTDRLLLIDPSLSHFVSPRSNEFGPVCHRVRTIQPHILTDGHID